MQGLNTPKVSVLDLETNTETIYPSMRAVARALNCLVGSISYYIKNGDKINRPPLGESGGGRSPHVFSGVPYSVSRRRKTLPLYPFPPSAYGVREGESPFPPPLHYLRSTIREGDGPSGLGVRESGRGF